MSPDRRFGAGRLFGLTPIAPGWPQAREDARAAEYGGEIPAEAADFALSPQSGSQGLDFQDAWVAAALTPTPRSPRSAEAEPRTQPEAESEWDAEATPGSMLLPVPVRLTSATALAEDPDAPEPRRLSATESDASADAGSVDDRHADRVDEG